MHPRYAWWLRGTPRRLLQLAHHVEHRVPGASRRPRARLEQALDRERPVALTMTELRELLHGVEQPEVGRDAVRSAGEIRSEERAVAGVGIEAP